MKTTAVGAIVARARVCRWRLLSPRSPEPVRRRPGSSEPISGLFGSASRRSRPRTRLDRDCHACRGLRRRRATPIWAASQSDGAASRAVTTRCCWRAPTTRGRAAASRWRDCVVGLPLLLRSSSKFRASATRGRRVLGAVRPAHDAASPTRRFAYSPSYLYGLFPGVMPTDPGECRRAAPDYSVERHASPTRTRRQRLGTHGLTRRGQLTGGARMQLHRLCARSRPSSET